MAAFASSFGKYYISQFTPRDSMTSSIIYLLCIFGVREGEVCLGISISLLDKNFPMQHSQARILDLLPLLPSLGQFLKIDPNI